MTMFARMAGDVVAELIVVPQGGPPLADLFHPDIVAAFRVLPMDHQVEVGWRLVADELVPPAPPPAPPPPPVPREVTNFQTRALLMGMPGSAEGRTLFQDVDDALRALGGVEWQAWEYTTTIPRQSALVAALAAQFDLTEAALDEMFRAAAQISV